MLDWNAGLEPPRLAGARDHEQLIVAEELRPALPAAAQEYDPACHRPTVGAPADQERGVAGELLVDVGEGDLLLLARPDFVENQYAWLAVGNRLAVRVPGVVIDIGIRDDGLCVPSVVDDKVGLLILLILIMERHVRQPSVRRVRRHSGALREVGDLPIVAAVGPHLVDLPVLAASSAEKGDPLAVRRPAGGTRVQPAGRNLTVELPSGIDDEDGRVIAGRLDRQNVRAVRRDVGPPGDASGLGAHPAIRAEQEHASIVALLEDPDPLHLRQVARFGLPLRPVVGPRGNGQQEN